MCGRVARPRAASRCALATAGIASAQDYRGGPDRGRDYRHEDFRGRLDITVRKDGRTFTFEEALDMKLINEIYDKDEYWDNVYAYAKQFCPPNKASKAVGLIKRSVQSGSEMAFQDSLALERELQQQLFQSSDAKEGIAAYVEKRTAKFEGK